MTNERAIQILEILISIEGDVIIGSEGKEALEKAIRSLRQEQPSEDLDKAAKEIATDILGKDYLSELDEDCAIDALNEATNLVKAGAEWQKQQMLKDAVEGKVVELGGTYKDLSVSVEGKELNEVLQLLGVKDGDRVRVIIVKEDKL